MFPNIEKGSYLNTWAEPFGLKRGEHFIAHLALPIIDILRVGFLCTGVGALLDYIFVFRRCHANNRDPVNQVANEILNNREGETIELRDIASPELSERTFSDATTVSSTENTVYFDAVEDLDDQNEILQNPKIELENHLISFVGDELSKIFVKFFKKEISSFEVDEEESFKITLNKEVENTIHLSHQILNGAKLCVPRIVEGTFSEGAIVFKKDREIIFKKKVLGFSREVRLHKLMLKDDRIHIETSLRKNAFTMKLSKFLEITLS